LRERSLALILVTRSMAITAITIQTPAKNASLKAITLIPDTVGAKIRAIAGINKKSTIVPIIVIKAYFLFVFASSLVRPGILLR